MLPLVLLTVSFLHMYVITSTPFCYLCLPITYTGSICWILWQPKYLVLGVALIFLKHFRCEVQRGRYYK